MPSARPPPSQPLPFQASRGQDRNTTRQHLTKVRPDTRKPRLQGNRLRAPDAGKRGLAGCGGTGGEAGKTDPLSPGRPLRFPVHTPSLVPDVHGGLTRGQALSCPRAAGLCLGSTLSTQETGYRAPPDGWRILGKSIPPGDLGKKEISVLWLLNSGAVGDARLATSLPCPWTQNVTPFQRTFSPLLIRNTSINF